MHALYLKSPCSYRRGCEGNSQIFLHRWSDNALTHAATDFPKDRLSLWKFRRYAKRFEHEVSKIETKRSNKFKPHFHYSSFFFQSTVSISTTKKLIVTRLQCGSGGCLITLGKKTIYRNQKRWPLSLYGVRYGQSWPNRLLRFTESK